MAENNKCCTSCLHLFRLYDGYCCKYRIGLIEAPNTDCCMWYKKVSVIDNDSYMSNSNLDVFAIFFISVVILWFCVLGYIFPIPK